MPDTTGSECSGKVEGVMLDRNILKNLKRKVYFLPGATIHLCKQTQISPLSVDY